MTTHNPFQDLEQSLGDDCHSPVDTHRLAGLLQPYIDGTISAEDRTWVDQQAAQDSGVYELLNEQTEVRSALQAMDPVAAPQALRARVLLELDAFDREQAQVTAEPQTSPWRRRLRALVRGAGLMVPAGATAVALFFVVRTSFAPVPEPTEPNSALSTEIGSGALPIQLGSPATNQPGLQPVALSSARSNSAKVVYSINGQLVIDQQQRAHTPKPLGTQVRYRGVTFFVGNSPQGPVVRFRHQGVDHELSFAPQKRPGDLPQSLLLEVGHMLATPEGASSAMR